MGQSHVNRRRRNSPIKRHADAVGLILDQICCDRRVRLSDTRRAEIVKVTVAMANPFAFSGIDIAIPAGRTDLVREFLERYLDGKIVKRRDLERVARELAPLPDDHFCRGPRAFGDPTSEQVASAYASQHRRLLRKSGGRATHR